MLIERATQSIPIAILLAVVLDVAAPGGLCFGAPEPTVTAPAAAVRKQSGPDLGVALLRSGADRRPLAAPGQVITLNVGINNLRGGGDAHSSVLTVKLPAGLTLQSASPSPVRTEDGLSLVWNLGTVEAGAFPRLFELNLAVAGSAAPGTQLTVSADVATSDREENLKNNGGSLTIFVQPAAADLNVRSDLDAVPLTIGGPVEFSGEVSNLGTIVASSSALTITLPTGISFKAGDPAPGATSDNTITWQLGDIEPGASRIVIVTIALAANLTPREFEPTPGPASLLHFKFDASTAATEANPADNHLEVTKPVESAGPDLKVWLNVEGADEPGELTVGRDVKYVIGYGNFGNRPASGATLSLSLAEGLSVLGGEPKPAGVEKSDRFGGGVISWNVGDLGVGDSKKVTVRVHVTSVPQHGSLTMATIAAPGTDIDPRNNVANVNLRAPRSASRMESTVGALGGGNVLWYGLLAALAVALISASAWAVWRAKRRDNVSQ